MSDKESQVVRPYLNSNLNPNLQRNLRPNTKNRGKQMFDAKKYTLSAPIVAIGSVELDSTIIYRTGGPISKTEA